jgi:hypothetical protein
MAKKEALNGIFRTMYGDPVVALEFYGIHPPVVEF